VILGGGFGVNRDEVHFILLQGSDRIMPEINPELAEYGARVLGKRCGAEIRTKTIVRAIQPGKVHLPEETIEAETIILAAGIVPNPVVAGLPVDKDKRGHIVITGQPDLGMPDYAGTKGRPEDFQPLTAENVTDVVALLAYWRTETVNGKRN
jgi:NADH dehydrogenase FAD-containing subunit